MELEFHVEAVFGWASEGVLRNDILVGEWIPSDEDIHVVGGAEVTHERGVDRVADRLQGVTDRGEVNATLVVTADTDVPDEFFFIVARHCCHDIDVH